MHVYPGDEPVSIVQTSFSEKDGFNLYTAKSGFHAGTHVDMPLHFVPGGAAGDGFKPELFIGRGVIIDARGENSIGYRRDFDDKIKAGDIVLVRTGFETYLDKPEIYFTKHPDISEGFAQFLAERKVRMLGLDTPSPDHEPYTVHKLLLSNGVFILENIINLELLSGFNHFDVFAVPIKIRAEASFVRAFAVIKDK